MPDFLGEHCLAGARTRKAEVRNSLGQSFRILREKKIPLPNNVLNIFLGIKETQMMKQLLESS